MNKIKEKVNSWKEWAKTHRNKLIVSASLIAALWIGTLWYTYSTRETRMHNVNDEKMSKEIFANVDKLKNVERVIFTSAWGKEEIFATVNHDTEENIVISHRDINVIINPIDKKVVGYDARWAITIDIDEGDINEKYKPRYLDDESINNIVNMCINGCIDFKSKLD